MDLELELCIFCVLGIGLIIKQTYFYLIPSKYYQSFFIFSRFQDISNSKMNFEKNIKILGSNLF